MLSIIKPKKYFFSLINTQENNFNYTVVLFSEETINNLDSISTITKQYDDHYNIHDWNKLTSNKQLSQLFRHLYNMYIKNSYNEFNVFIELTPKSYKLLDVNIL